MSTLKVGGIRGVSASSDAITVANDGTCTANITNNLSNKNLIINGAYTINQYRKTGHGSSGYRVVDRWTMSAGGLNNAMHQYQVDITAGDLPYTKGFRKMYRLTNDGQNADSNDYIQAVQHIEAQNIATSGWNYVSSSSDITLSFYVRASVSQTYHGYLQTHDGTSKTNSFSFALTANTWTKVTKTFPGDSSITINNDNGVGLTLHFTPFMGTDYTASSVTDGAWQTYASGARTTDQTSTWMTTAYSTFELTGVQLEVGSIATDFEHRTFHDELHRCFRYYYEIAPPVAESLIGDSLNYDTSDHMTLRFPVEMRIEPEFVCSDFSNAFRIYGSSGGRNVSTLTVNTGVGSTKAIMIECSGGTNGSQNFVRIYNANSGTYATIAANAEL